MNTIVKYYIFFLIFIILVSIGSFFYYSGCNPAFSSPIPNLDGSCKYNTTGKETLKYNDIVTLELSDQYLNIDVDDYKKDLTETAFLTLSKQPDYFRIYEANDQLNLKNNIIYSSENNSRLFIKHIESGSDLCTYSDLYDCDDKGSNCKIDNYLILCNENNKDKTIFNVYNTFDKGALPEKFSLKTSDGNSITKSKKQKKSNLILGKDGDEIKYTVL